MARIYVLVLFVQAHTSKQRRLAVLNQVDDGSSRAY